MARPWATPGLDLHVESTGPGLRKALTKALREAVRSGHPAPGCPKRSAPGTRRPAPGCLPPARSAPQEGLRRNIGVPVLLATGGGLPDLSEC
ncbi:hypothetical protein SAMN04487982_107271 [Streptomyces sp. ok210]|nr:hypothetical protein SAMN04487982_107271 [Streptomyces sp. ok210]